MTAINKIIWEDLEEITATSEKSLQKIVNSQVVLTGASGFVGKWLTLSFLNSRRNLNGQGEIVLNCRNPESLISLLQEAGFNDGYRALPGDVRNFPLGVIEDHSLMINAATPASASFNSQRPLEMYEIIVEGQRRLLELASQKTSVRMLFLSSGAVYGMQPLHQNEIDENWSGAPDITNPNNSYHEGKRVAELMGAIYSSTSSTHIMTARLFAFLAPFLPLREHFAAGNFLADAIDGQPIQINSGGGSVRSYQYASDLCNSLWTILERGRRNDVFNVGSDEQVTIRELARKITIASDTGLPIQINGIDTPENVSRYVPSVQKISKQLGVKNKVDVDEAIRRTLSWLTLD